MNKENHDNSWIFMYHTIFIYKILCWHGIQVEITPSDYIWTCRTMSLLHQGTSFFDFRILQFALFPFTMSIPLI